MVEDKSIHALSAEFLSTGGVAPNRGDLHAHANRCSGSGASLDAAHFCRPDGANADGCDCWGSEILPTFSPHAKTRGLVSGGLKVRKQWFIASFESASGKIEGWEWKKSRPASQRKPTFKSTLQLARLERLNLSTRVHAGVKCFMARYKYSVVALLLFVSSTAIADVVWPALILEPHLLSWWAIGVGLLAEYLFVLRIFELPAPRATFAVVIANSVSTVAGFFLIPIAGIIWEFLAGTLLLRVLNWGTFNPITWAATFVLACLINTWLEAMVYRRGFKLKVGRRAFWWLALANAVSVGLAFVTLFLSAHDRT